MQAILSVSFNLTSEDLARIDNAISLLEEIKDGFEKCGIYSEDDTTALKHASHILDEIRRGETF